MAMTVNGYVAGQNDNVDWVSEDSWKSYMKKVEESNAAIIGRKTYELMPADEFVSSCAYAVLTSQTNLDKKIENVFFGENPSAIISEFTNKGLQSICVLGGGETNSSFMKEGLIDELYLDVEPIALGSGTQLFSPSDFQYNLELLETKKLSDNLVQLHYKVVR